MNKKPEPPRNKWPLEQEELLRKHYATTPIEELVVMLGRPTRSIYAKAHLMNLVRRKYKRKPHQSFAIVGQARVVKEILGDTSADMPILNSTARGRYDGSELRPFAGRPGAMDAFALPSRIGSRRIYRDGRAEHA